MSENSSPPDEDASLAHWRQGDFALGVGGFIFATTPEGDEAFDPDEQIEDVIGLVAITQSCDIVRRNGGRHYIAVCPLIEIAENDIAAVKKGLKPYLTDVENAPANTFADFRRIMSVDKDVVRNWPRKDGFASEEGRVRFAAALERKFGQFAFPDAFDSAIESFRKRVWRRHDKEESPVGKVYRSLAQIRFRAKPDWDANKRAISVIAILKPNEKWEVDRKAVSEEINNALDEIALPEGFEWDEPRCLLATANDLTGEDIITSRRGDFDFLCY